MRADQEKALSLEDFVQALLRNLVAEIPYENLALRFRDQLRTGLAIAVQESADQTNFSLKPEEVPGIVNYLEVELSRAKLN